VSSTSCGAPVRYGGAMFIVLGVGGAVMAIVAFVLRLCASLGNRGRALSWDDVTMGIVVGLAIPPAVLVYYYEYPLLTRDELGF